MYSLKILYFHVIIKTIMENLIEIDLGWYVIARYELFSTHVFKRILRAGAIVQKIEFLFVCG